jgi:riboflavin kinase/FMN adenylyltransferase
MKVHRGLHNLPKFKNAILTMGTYDGVHFGHRQIIKRVTELAQEIGGESIMLTYDPHPRIALNPNTKLQLLCTLDEKIEMLSQFDLDHVVIAPFTKEFASIDAKDYVTEFLLKHFSPHTIVIGYDHHFGKNRMGNIDLLKELSNTYNYNVEEISKQTIDDIAVSSTKIRNALLEGNVTTANQLLLSPYTLKGRIIHGNKIGRTLGFPTANVDILESQKLIPHIGVYAVKVEYNLEIFDGVLSIGYRPTVVEDSKLTVEVFIFDFSKSIYDEELKIIFIEKIRDEVKFESREELIEKMHEDVAKAKVILSK